MCSAPWPRNAIGRVFVRFLAGLALTAGVGCSRLNLWEGPSYRDDPVVSDADTSTSTAPSSGSSHPSRREAHAEPLNEVKTSRANR